MVYKKKRASKTAHTLKQTHSRSEKVCTGQLYLKSKTDLYAWLFLKIQLVFLKTCLLIHCFFS